MNSDVIVNELLKTCHKHLQWVKLTSPIWCHKMSIEAVDISQFIVLLPQRKTSRWDYSKQKTQTTVRTKSIAVIYLNRPPLHEMLPAFTLWFIDSIRSVLCIATPWAAKHARYDVPPPCRPCWSRRWHWEQRHVQAHSWPLQACPSHRCGCPSALSHGPAYNRTGQPRCRCSWQRNPSSSSYDAWPAIWKDTIQDTIQTIVNNTVFFFCSFVYSKLYKKAYRFNEDCPHFPNFSGMHRYQFMPKPAVVS